MALSRAQRETLSKLAQDGWFLLLMAGRYYFFRKTWTHENMGSLRSDHTFNALRRRDLIEEHVYPADDHIMREMRVWRISDVGRKVLKLEYQQRMAAEAPDVEYTDQHGGY